MFNKNNNHTVMALSFYKQKNFQQRPKKLVKIAKNILVAKFYKQIINRL